MAPTTTPVLLDAVDIVRLVADVRDLAKEHPHNTADCIYANEKGDTVCIVGQALERQHVDIQTLRSRNGSRVVGLLWGAFAKMKDVARKVWAQRWLDKVQRCQDRGETWAAAVRTADEAWPQPK